MRVGRVETGEHFISGGSESRSRILVRGLFS